MKQVVTHDRTSPLFAELQRFVKYRWFAGLTLILGAIANANWSDWSERQSLVLLLGTAILAYNIILWIILWRYRSDRHTLFSLTCLSWVQILLDLLCLSTLVLWTGGLTSPMLGLFVLHMVFASILLTPLSAFLSALVAVGFVSGGLLIRDQWPQSNFEELIGVGWIVTLLMTIHLTNHIAQSLRKREGEVSDRNQRIQAIVETAADGIITIDQESTILSVNPAAESIFGYRSPELLGKDITLLIPEPFRSKHAGYIEQYLRDGESKIIGVGREVVGKRKDGTVFPLDAAVSVVPLADGIHFTAIVRDITERKEAEDRLHQLNDELQQQQRVLVQSEKMGAMGQMAAGIAHEISNPLASMDSLLQLASRNPDKLNLQTAQTLREQIDRIGQIVHQMTDFAHPNERGWEQVDLNDIVRNALEMIRFDHRIRDVEVALELSPEVDQIQIIPNAMQQILVNMILNALDALDGISEPCLHLSTKAVNNHFLIEIGDNGQGIPDQEINRIFEPFFTTKPVGKGTGLGLSISFSLITQLKGTCEVQSVEGEGTKFIISLPRPAASNNRE